MTELKIHPIAARFPAFSKDELETLAQDIKANKQHLPITLTADGTTIVDGVNRWKACKLAGVKPKFKRLPKSYTKLDILKFSISANMRRRDLNPGQRAMLGAEFAPELERVAQERLHEALQRGRNTQKKKKRKRAPERQSVDRSGTVDYQIAAMVKVGSGTAGQAKRVKAHSEALAQRVIDDEISLKEAHRIMMREKKTQKPDDGAAGKHFTTVITHTGKTANYPLPKSKAHFIPTNDQVSWAAWTWTVVSGCLHNCPYCYAREGTEVNQNLKKHYPFGFAPTFFEHRLDAPKNSALPDGWKKDPRLGRVFVSSMGDLFGKWVPDEWIEKVFAACRSAPWWEYLFLTKFPQRYVELLENGVMFPETAWLGTTVDVQDRVKIAETAFRKIKGVRLKWLSIEPMLERLTFSNLSMFDFIVIGSQSATNQPDGKGGIIRVPEFSPPFEWVADLTAQAKAAGRAIYHKPNLLGIPNDQCAGMKLIQEVPDLPELPARTQQGEMFEAAE